MNRGKKANRIVLIVISALLMLSVAVPAFPAYAAEEAPVELAGDIEEYIDATDAAEEADPVFGTGRIKVKRILDTSEGAAEAVCFDGNTLLSYGSAADAREAYPLLVEKYGAANVVVDLPVMTAESSAKPVGWGVDYMNLDDEKSRTVKKSGQTGKAVTVAVIDSGVLAAHEIFDGKTISSASKSLLGESDTIADENGHGTEVAGIVAEATTDNVELMILKVFVDGTSISTETVGQAVRYAADNGADVINLSMATNFQAGYAEEYSDLVSSVINDMEEQLKYAADQGVIICAASGNDGGDIDELYSYPARSPNTIAVGSIDKEGKRSWFSNYGSTLDFCAPGEELITASKDDATKYVFPLDSGTSLATPYISACCAFIKMNEPGADNVSAKESMKGIATDLGETGWDKDFGWGMPKYEEFTDKDQSGDQKTPESKTPESKTPAAKTKKAESVTINTSKVTAKKVRSAIRKAGTETKYVKQIILGSKVRKISKDAFKGTKAATLVLKTKKLTKKSVRYSLRGSKIKTLRVKVAGKSKINKKKEV